MDKPTDAMRTPNHILLLCLTLLICCAPEEFGVDDPEAPFEDGGSDEKQREKAPKAPKGGGTTSGTTGGTAGQGGTCREGVIVTSSGASDVRAACTQPYPWPTSNAVSDWKNYCGLCAASTSVPYNPFDQADTHAFSSYADRGIGSPPTTCVQALLSASAFHRTSQGCAKFRATYAGICCGREAACRYSATQYTDTPKTLCGNSNAGPGCRCADTLTAPGKPALALKFAESTFSATSPFASAVRNGNLCGVVMTKSAFGTGQYETTCSRLYEAARRGFTGKQECGVMENMLRTMCGSLPTSL